MLVFNGMKYAKNDKEFTESLFQSGGTCNGFYKKMRNGIRLLDMQGNIRAFIVNNKYNEQFVVSASQTDNGIRYMFSTTTQDEKWLGIDKLGYRDTIEACKRVFN